MYPPGTRITIGRALAGAFLAGGWDEDALTRRGAGVFAPPPPPWLPSVVRAVLRVHHRPPLDAPRELAELIAGTLEQLGPVSAPMPRVVRQRVFTPAMGRRRFGVPELASPADLAALLGVSSGTLAWLADVRSLERRAGDERLRNYRYTWITRTSAAPAAGRTPSRVRVIERPKARLKAAQRCLLREVLMGIPAHPAAHGFVPGRSATTHAALHAGRRIVLRFDVEDFFAAVTAGRVWAVFRAAGYPEAVAHALTGLCTNVVPGHEWAAVPRVSVDGPPALPGARQEPSGTDGRSPARAATLAAINAHHRLGRRLATPHLPQGAPTSPALANLVAHRLDRRLAGLARSIGATYSRYADDLVLSGDRELQRRVAATRAAVATIVTDEGFVLHPDKSQLMHRAGRQRVCGMVVNVAPNLARDEFDRLRAVLHDAAIHSPEHANRAGLPNFRAHLTGRVAWAASLNPARGARLRAQLAAIDWDLAG